MLLVENVRLDPAEVRGMYDIELNVIADFAIHVDGCTVLTEPYISVVELALSLRAWLRHGLPQHMDFEYRSTEHDEPGIVWLRHQQPGWLVGSIWQEQPCLTVLADGDVEEVFGRFVADMDAWLRSHLRLTLDAVGVGRLPGR